jgi:hypothetical protein
MEQNQWSLFFQQKGQHQYSNIVHLLACNVVGAFHCAQYLCRHLLQEQEPFVLEHVVGPLFGAFVVGVVLAVGVGCCAPLLLQKKKEEE